MPSSALPLAMLPLPAAPQPTRAKRRQVKNACTNCQKACKKCDDARPCLRCVKYGMQEACISSQRKERKKGVKRGPYKKRESKERQSAPHDAPQPLPHLVQPIPPPVSPPPHPPYMSIGLPPAYYPPHPLSKTADPPPLYPPYLFAQLQPVHPSHNAQDGVSPTYSPPGPYYPAALLAQFSPSIYAQYPVPRPDAQLLHPNIQYTLYGHHTCARQTEDPGRSAVDHCESPH
ncbi:hypothetical protein AX14_010903 [Amanita brunnescens Koide BX004]|nr:hypothetical protein AX14_010903 [Amanita brunnescens Koide BX004]